LPSNIEEATPGIGAQTTQYWDETITLYEQRTQEISDYIMAQPGEIDEAELRAIKDSYDAELEAVKAKYPDVEEFEGRRDRRKNAMNPFEEAAQVVEDIMRYKPDGYPEWPGDDATKEEVQEYYRQKGVWAEKRLDHKERVLEQMLLDDTGAADDASNIVAQIVTGHFAGDILAAFDMRYSSGPEIFYERQKDYQGALNDQAWEQRNAQKAAEEAERNARLNSELGPESVDLLNSYLALPKGEARQEFRAQNDEMYEVLDVAYTPEKRQQAKELWGEDIYEFAKTWPGPYKEDKEAWKACWYMQDIPMAYHH
jgi:hypothetical protein